MSKCKNCAYYYGEIDWCMYGEPGSHRRTNPCLKIRVKNLIAKLMRLLHIDYRIVGEYYDTDKNGHSVKKYYKKYYFKR